MTEPEPVLGTLELTNEPARSTLELVVLMVTATVCGMLLLLAAAIAVIEVAHPDADTSTGAQALITAGAAILAAGIGVFAGRGLRRK